MNKSELIDAMAADAGITKQPQESFRFFHVDVTNTLSKETKLL